MFIGKEEVDIIKNLIIDAYNLLNSHKIIKTLKKDEIFGKRITSETQVAKILRSAESLTKPTNGIYNAPGKRKYYLDLYKDSKILKEDIIFLLKLIYENKMATLMKQELINFCKYNAHKKAIFIYGIKDLEFINPYYDEFLEGSLKEFYLENGIFL